MSWGAGAGGIKYLGHAVAPGTGGPCSKCIPWCPAMPVGLSTVPTIPLLPAALGQTPAQAMPAELRHSRSPPYHRHPQGDRGWDGGSCWDWFAPGTRWHTSGQWSLCQDGGCWW